MVARFQTLLSIVNFTWIDHFGSTLDFVPSGFTEATSRGSARSVHVAECAADAIVTSGSDSSDPTLSDSAGPPPAWPTDPSLGRAL